MRVLTPRTLLAVCLLVAALVPVGGVLAQEVDWVMNRRIGPPPGFTGSGYSASGVLSASGDHNFDTYPEGLHHVNLVSQSNTSEYFLGIVNGAGMTVDWEVTVPTLLPVQVLATTLMSSPRGMLLAMPARSRQRLHFYDPAIQQFVASLPLPSPPSPGLPAPYGTDGLMFAGDVDGDGFEDLYAQFSATDPITQQYFVVMCLVDGASLQYSWVQYLASAIPVLARRSPLFADPWQDLDHDGITDVLIATNGSIGSSVMALSGRDGSVLWEVVRPAEALMSWSYLSDLNGDGIREVGTVTGVDWNSPAAGRLPGSIRVLDGASGALLWDNPYGNLLPWLNTVGDLRTVEPSPHSMVGSGDHDRDGFADVVVDMYERADFLDRGYVMSWVFDGRTGAFLSREITAHTQYPWSSDPLQGGGSRSIEHAQSCPDLDGDGWPERAFLFVVSGSGYSNAFDLIILQRRTLRVGAQLHLGSAANYELDLPACGGLSYAVLFSGSFSPWPGGLRFGPWNVALGIDPVLLASSQEPALSGVLGPSGLAQGTFPMSSDARLLGRTLFSRAVVFDAAAPGGVRTLSSLEYSVVVP